MAIKKIDSRRILLNDLDLLLPVFGNINYRDIGLVVREMKLISPRLNGLNLAFWNDNDGVMRDDWSVSRKVDGRKDLTWEFTARYSDFVMTTGNLLKHDYTRTQARFSGSAHKMAKQVSNEAYDFWIEQVILDGEVSLIHQELTAVVEHHAKLKAAALSVEAWLASGFDVRVCCASKFCNSKIFPASILEKYTAPGRDLATFREALVCKKCGKRMPQISPYLSQDSEKI